MGRKHKVPEQTPQEAAHELSINLANAAEIFAPVRDAVNGYKQSYIQLGWSPEAAETLACQYHMVLCHGFLPGEHHG